MVSSFFKVINMKKRTPEEHSPVESDGMHCQHWEGAPFPTHSKGIRWL